MSHHAHGSFEVKLTPEAEDKAEGATLGRMALHKIYHGALDGPSEGTMLTARADVAGSAGYTAFERFRGTLEGHSGSFVLQHSGTMSHGALEQKILIVPDTGTGELQGIVGTMTITITGQTHEYDLDYLLAPPR